MPVICNVGLKRNIVDMKMVQIDIFRSGPSGTDEKKLIKSTQVHVKSNKPLNAKRIQQILKKHLPEFDCCGVTEIPNGWQAMRAVVPTQKCNYHYVWEYVQISLPLNPIIYKVNDPH